MKGLLIKDIKLILSNKQVFIILFFVGIMQFAGNNDGSFLAAVSYFSFMMGMLAISTISYDEFEEGTQFLLTLPVTRKLYAVSKYAILFLLSFIGWLVPVFVSVATTISSGNENHWMDWWMIRIVIWLTVNLIMLIALPIQLKFGSTHGRLVVFAVVAMVVLIPVFGRSILQSAGVDPGLILSRITAVTANLGSVSFAAGAVLLFLASLAISLAVSVHVMEKKEF